MVEQDRLVPRPPRQVVVEVVASPIMAAPAPLQQAGHPGQVGLRRAAAALPAATHQPMAVPAALAVPTSEWPRLEVLLVGPRREAVLAAVAMPALRQREEVVAGPGRLPPRRPAFLAPMGVAFLAWQAKAALGAAGKLAEPQVRAVMAARQAEAEAEAVMAAIIPAHSEQVVPAVVDRLP